MGSARPCFLAGRLGQQFYLLLTFGSFPLRTGNLTPALQGCCEDGPVPEARGPRLSAYTMGQVGAVSWGSTCLPAGLVLDQFIQEGSTG